DAGTYLIARGGGAQIDISDSEKEVSGATVTAEAGSSQKKRKNISGKAVVVNHGMESYVDRALTKKEQDKADTQLLKWFVHGNIPFSQADNPFFTKWVESIQL
ncbi:hypothetical protein BDQ17DRAFT_1213948, partial [Cyathus striatus]